MLDQSKHVDLESGCRCRYVRSDTEYFRLHCHNYYEIFMVMSGDICHIINGKEQKLTSGQLLFIRDFDVHDYKSANSDDFEFVNLAFTKDTLKDMFQYLGKNFPSKELLSTKYPPSVILSEREKDALFYEMIALSGTLDKEAVRITMRTLLINIFTKYFYEYSEKKTEIPAWLEITYEKIKMPANFIKGIERLYEICPKSREHLCRSLKKYYNTSPSALINDLRLEYCRNLLLTSNLSATDICYECGFENISWFYKLFEKKYGMAPSKYRCKYK